MTCRLVTPGGHPGDNILHRAAEELEERFAASLEPAILRQVNGLGGYTATTRRRQGEAGERQPRSRPRDAWWARPRP